MDSDSETSAGFAFGHFGVLPHRRELFANGEPIKLGGRAFDVLMALIEARGAVLSKDALMARVWPGRIVDENNLQSQIVVLRKAFGADRDLIRTVSGRGYQFTGQLRTLPSQAGSHAAAIKTVAALPPTNLPEAVSELIGREHEVGEVLNLATARRLVTLTGAGGIGKTRLALALARELLPHFADGVWLAEFSPLTDPGLLPATVAAAVGLELGGGEISVQRVAQMLAGRRLLLVLDTCEHVIDMAAVLAEALLRAGAAAQIIATSREPLRVEGEWIYPVPPLAVPAANLQAEDDPLQYGAVRLFIERARAAQRRFIPDGRTVMGIAAICRQLDGVPLAIELAAARTTALEIEELSARLDDRFHLLTGGRRTALPRHQTLRAMLDWSHELLRDRERVILRRLGIFSGAFSLESASAVASSAEIARSDVVEGLASLVAKSLITVEASGRVARYRLLDTMRAYALGKLTESGEREQIARRLAEQGLTISERAEAEWETRPTAEWLADYAWRIDNLRGALDWTFSRSGDASIGVALTAASVPLWMQLSLMDECRGRVEQALAAIAAGMDCEPRREMKLHAALAASLTYAGGVLRELDAAWTKTLELAEQLDDAEYQLRAVWELWTLHRVNRWHRAALTQAERYCALAANRADPNHRLIGERMLGISRHYSGDQVRARRHLEGVPAAYVEAGNRSHIVRFQVDLRVSARTFLAPVLWLLGFPDRAMRAAEAAIEEARSAHHALSLSHALVFGACPTALLAGDLPSGERFARMLIDHSATHGLARWHAYASGYQGALLIRGGDITAGLQLLRAGVDELGGFTTLRFMDLLMPEALHRAGEIAEGLASVDAAIARSEDTEEHRLTPELLRIKGELLLLRDGSDASAEAEDLFRQALDWARRQETLSWELRAATSLGRLLGDQGRSGEGLAILQPIYDRFSEGFDTADLKTGRSLIDILGQSNSGSTRAALARLRLVKDGGRAPPTTDVS